LQVHIQTRQNCANVLEQYTVPIFKVDGLSQESSHQKAGGFLLNSLFDPERGGGLFLQNVGKILLDYTELQTAKIIIFIASMHNKVSNFPNE
jgi:hypothetical protein